LPLKSCIFDGAQSNMQYRKRTVNASGAKKDPQLPGSLNFQLARPSFGEITRR
jgi:hypothetical protein